MINDQNLGQCRALSRGYMPHHRPGPPEQNYSRPHWSVSSTISNWSSSSSTSSMVMIPTGSSSERVHVGKKGGERACEGPANMRRQGRSPRW